MRMLLLPLLATLAVAGCPGPQKAPEDLDGLARFLFDRFDPTDVDATTSDSELADAFTKLDVTVHGDAVTDPQKGVLANITQAELDTVGVTADPDVPQGIFIIDVVHCSVKRLKEIILEPDQLSLYTDAYAAYARTFDPDRPATLPTWSATYTSAENALFTNQFTTTVKSGMRVLPDDRLVTRVFMPAPATWESEGAQFTQDYQTEAFYPRKPGELVHFYAMWRYMSFGAVGDSRSGLFIDQTTSALVDWDTKTDALCAQ